jgi:CRP-like cAMP-binding protein
MLTIFYTNDIIRIFFHLTEKKFTHHETVFGQDDRASALFYISKGKINFFVKHGTV